MTPETHYFRTATGTIVAVDLPRPNIHDQERHDAAVANADLVEIPAARIRVDVEERSHVMAGVAVPYNVVTYVEIAEQAAAKSEPPAPTLETMTGPQLRTFAAEHNIPIPSGNVKVDDLRAGIVEFLGEVAAYLDATGS